MERWSGKMLRNKATANTWWCWRFFLWQTLRMKTLKERTFWLLKLSRNGFCARKKAKGRKIKHCEKKIENGMSWPRQQQHNQNEPFVKRTKQTLAIPDEHKGKPFVTQSQSFLFFSLLLLFFVLWLFFFVKFFFVYNFSFACVSFKVVFFLSRTSILAFSRMFKRILSTFTQDLNGRTENKPLSNAMIYDAMNIIHTLG